jgi:hypothetical protein
VWLLLCTSDDHDALWAAERLRARGLSPLITLTPELLHFSFRWHHLLRSDEPASIEFTLADGVAIRGGEIRGVLNRIAALPPHLVSHLAPPDQAYALQEWTALHISWLASLRAPVINRPVMQGFCGAWRHESEWSWLAHQAGLRTPPFRQRADIDAAGAQSPASRRPWETQTVFVIDGRVVGEDVGEETAAACALLGRLSDTRMIGIDLDRTTDQFVGASPRPWLRPGGEPLISALHAALVANV